MTVHGYWYENRSDAGRELAKALAPERAGLPVVLSISPGGLVVGAEVAEAFGTNVDVLLTHALRQGDVAVGAICEDGTTRFDPETVDTTGTVSEREKLLSEAQKTLKKTAMRLRGPRWIDNCALPSDRALAERISG